MVATRKLEIQITGDADSAGRMFSKIRGEADDTENRFSKWGKAVAGAVGFAFATDAIFTWGSSLISAAEDAQKVTEQTSAVIESMGAASWTTADAIAGLAEKISLKTGLDDEMIQSGENVLLTFGNITDQIGEGNDVFTRATEVATDMSVALGQDLQSSITQIGKALNDPIEGLSALSRVGVQFTDDQKNMITQLVATGDTLGAQKIILQELERQFGGSAEAQVTASDKLRVAWDNVKEKLGNELLPIFEKVATWLAETLPGAIDTTITWIKEHKTQVELLAIAVGVVLVAAFAAYTVQALMAAAATIAATWPILLIIALIAILAAGIIYAYTHWGWFRDAVDGAARALAIAARTLQEIFGWLVRTAEAASDLANALDRISPGSPLKGGFEGSGVKVGKTVPKLAGGGLVMAPTLAMVGEAGPEAVIPLGRGGGLGGDTYIFNVSHQGIIDADGLFRTLNDGMDRGRKLRDRGRRL